MITSNGKTTPRTKQWWARSSHTTEARSAKFKVALSSLSKRRAYTIHEWSACQGGRFRTQSWQMVGVAARTDLFTKPYWKIKCCIGDSENQCVSANDGRSRVQFLADLVSEKRILACFFHNTTSGFHLYRRTEQVKQFHDSVLLWPGAIPPLSASRAVSHLKLLDAVHRSPYFKQVSPTFCRVHWMWPMAWPESLRASFWRTRVSGDIVSTSWPQLVSFVERLTGRDAHGSCVQIFYISWLDAFLQVHLHDFGLQRQLDLVLDDLELQAFISLTLRCGKRSCGALLNFDPSGSAGIGCDPRDNSVFRRQPCRSKLAFTLK